MNGINHEVNMTRFKSAALPALAFGLGALLIKNVLVVSTA